MSGFRQKLDDDLGRLQSTLTQTSIVSNRIQSPSTLTLKFVYLTVTRAKRTTACRTKIENLTLFQLKDRACIPNIVVKRRKKFIL